MLPKFCLKILYKMKSSVDFWVVYYLEVHKHSKKEQRSQSCEIELSAEFLGATSDVAPSTMTCWFQDMRNALVQSRELHLTVLCGYGRTPAMRSCQSLILVPRLSIRELCFTALFYPESVSVGCLGGCIHQDISIKDFFLNLAA